MSPLPQYYEILGVDANATEIEIRTAYRKASLRTHPDREPNATPAQKKVLTEKFQAVADAYYVLQNPQRRKEYDALLRSRSSNARANATSSGAPGGAGGFPFSTDPGASAAFFEQFKSFFGKPGAKAAAAEGGEEHEMEEEEEELKDDWKRPNADEVFGDVFDELLRPEVQRRVNWWTYIGALSGAGIGYILGNVPGALAGGLAGNRLGAIRDAKGKPVMVVFANLGGSQKAEILKALALKVFGSLGSM